MSKYVLKQREDSDETNARNAIRPGNLLFGYCGGLFGRESYGDKKVVSVHSDHLVVTEDGHTLVSRTIDGESYTWAGLILDSNNSLEEDNYERNTNPTYGDED